MKATEVTAGLAESSSSLLPGLWRDSLHVTCGLTARTPGSAPGPTLVNEYGKTLPFTKKEDVATKRSDSFNRRVKIWLQQFDFSIMWTRQLLQVANADITVTCLNN